jgi:hypothetical protein
MCRVVRAFASGGKLLESWEGRWEMVVSRTSLSLNVQVLVYGLMEERYNTDECPASSVWSIACKKVNRRRSKERNNVCMTRKRHWAYGSATCGDRNYMYLQG